jgi:ATP phosphoribosyltransferase
LLKAADIPLFVQDGSLDLGILGKDSVLESGMDDCEIYRLSFSKCRLCIAGPKERVLLNNGIRVATKYPEITKQIMKKRNIDATIIQLSGSLELAPLIKLSDVIVDLVQSGQTLRENDLEVYETLMDISATVIANCKSRRTKKIEIALFLGVCAKLEVLSEAI